MGMAGAQLRLMMNSVAASDLQRFWGSSSIQYIGRFFPHLAKSGCPRWDGSRVLFELAVGATRIPCAISRAALDNVGGQRQAGGEAYVWCFLANREHIEAVVHDKLGEMPGGLSSLMGTLNIWASDLDDVPPSGASVECRKYSQRLSA